MMMIIHLSESVAKNIFQCKIYGKQMIFDHHHRISGSSSASLIFFLSKKKDLYDKTPKIWSFTKNMLPHNHTAIDRHERQMFTMSMKKKNKQNRKSLPFSKHQKKKKDAKMIATMLLLSCSFYTLLMAIFNNVYTQQLNIWKQMAKKKKWSQQQKQIRYRF